MNKQAVWKIKVDMVKPPKADKLGREFISVKSGEQWMVCYEQNVIQKLKEGMTVEVLVDITSKQGEKEFVKILDFASEQKQTSNGEEMITLLRKIYALIEEVHDWIETQPNESRIGGDKLPL